MAALGTTMPTLHDLSKTVNAGWTASLPIIELLAKRMGLYSALRWEEANEGIRHRTSVRTGLPSAAYRLLNLGLTPSDGSYANATFPVAKIGTVGEVDEELVKIAPDKTKFIANKMVGHIEAVLQKLSFELFYGTAATAEGIIGLGAIYGSLSAENAQNIIAGGGSDASDNASIYLLNCGPNLKGLYPRGTPAGIERNVRGYVDSESLGTSGAKGLVWREYIHVGAGLAVEDWRDGVRVANIDVSALLAESSDADLLKLTRKAKHRMLSRPMYDRKWVMHSTVFEYIEHQRDAKQVAGGGVSKATIDGVEVPTLHGYPVVIDDDMVLTEAPVT